MMSQRLYFRLALSPEGYLHYYRGRARAVIVEAEDGRRVQLPANALRPYVTREGVHGRFELTLDEHNKLIALTRLSD